MPRRWDIFCRVIDNFGDIGVSWRLARQLVDEHGAQVRLWVDQLEALAAMVPQVDPQSPQQALEGVTVFRLTADTAFPAPGNVVIEAFGCGLPPAYVAAIAAQAQKPLWIVLEYLSAEPWVSEHHGLPSPHPRLGVPRHFFFPGVSAGTGGVLREAGLISRRDAFDAAARRAWWSQLGFAPVAPDALAVSLFAYPHAPVAALIEACAAQAKPAVLAVPNTPLAAHVREIIKCAHAAAGRIGNVELRFLPFVPQREFDKLLWACDVNFVRGEDSFARAQWAGKPFVWHIYPQADRAHEVKLDAFLDVYSRHLSPASAVALRGMWLAWNGVAGAPPLADAWWGCCAAHAELRTGACAWQAQLQTVGDLAGNLVKFCTDRV